MNRGKRRPTTGILRVLGLLSVAALVSVSHSSNGQESADSDDQYRRVLDKAILKKGDDREVLVREHLYPPGWRAPTHYHDGDLFIYVVEGEFEVVTDEKGAVVYRPGDALQMAAATTMDARNASDTEPLKLVIFQVGVPGGPFLVPVE